MAAAVADGALAATPPAMIVPGDFAVSATGTATYSMPIAVPPGAAGMAPSLSLNYSSQSGNGILGFGWSLGGMPSITRCPRTVAEDGVHGTVNFDGDDRFCLDGQRLLVTSGTYGANNSQYRTELESFTKVIAHTVSGVSGPGWFEVHTRSGQIVELGNTTDSRILPVDVGGGTRNVARVWAANKISDTVGNYLTVTYVNDTTNGQYYPDHILYTGNTSAGTTPFASIYFSYVARSDATLAYHAGTVAQTTKLLSDIKTFTNTTGTGTPVTDYQLTYQLGNAPYYQLIQVKRCAGSGGTNCLAPTTFGWQDTSAWTTRIAIDSTPAMPTTYPIGFFRNVDFNGDGIPDGIGSGDSSHLCQVPIYESPLSLGSPLGVGGLVPADMTETYSSGTTQTACLTYQNPIFADGVLGDIDGDGFTDMYNTMALFHNNGNGTFTQIGIYGFGSGSRDGPQDYDGDGRNADGFGYSSSSQILSFTYARGGATFDSASYTVAGDSTTIARAAGDADGDGCADVLLQNTLNEVFSACNPTHPLPIGDFGATAQPFQGSQGVWGDFNGDGNSDYLYVPCPDKPGHGTLNISTGAGFITSSPSGITCGAYSTNQFFTGDYDGDGKIDVIMVDRNGMYVYTWVGNALTQVMSLAVHLPQADCAAGTCTDPDYNGNLQVTDVDGDGCSDLVVSHLSSGYYFKFGCHPPLLMTSISNGIGAETDIAYDRLNRNQPLYTKCPASPTSYLCGDTYPTQAVDGPIYVVRQIDTSNGLGDCSPSLDHATAYCFTTTYTYGGAKNDLTGRGFQGFQKVVETNLNSGVVRTTLYNTQFPLTGTPIEQTLTYGAYTLSDTTNSYGTVPAVPVMGTPTFVFPSTVHVAQGEADGTALPSSTTTYTNYDGFGNAKTITTTVSDGSSKVTNSDFYNDPLLWILGKMTSTSVTSTVGSSVITRTSTFAYNLTNGVLIEEVVEPTATTCNGNSTACELDTVYGLDSFGHHNSKTVSGVGFTTRTSGTGYDASGRFLSSITNALGHAESFDFSGTGGAAFGVPTGHTDLNNHTVAWQYDGFGRRTRETLPGVNGTITQGDYRYCSGVNGGSESCPSLGAYVMIVTPFAHDGTTRNGGVTKTYYDALSRVIAVDTEGFDGASTGCTVASPCWVRVDTRYEAHGYTDRTTRPYMVAGGTQQWTVYAYCSDPSGRPCTVTAPDSGVTHYAYTGLGDAGTQTTVTDPLSHARTTRMNAQGLKSSVTDARNKTMSYVYDAYGDLLQTTDNAGNQIVNSYDIRGNKLTSDDPDVGHWSYTYDALGEILTQTDPNEAASSQHSTMVYDVLGRLKQRIDPDQTSTWTYDTANHGIGMLASAAASVSSYNRTHNYDTLSRPTKVTLTIGTTNYIYNRSYNTDGRLDTLTYPSGLVVKYVYTTLGYLQQLKDNATGAVLWTATSRDAELHLTEQVTGNGVDTIQYFNPQTGRMEQVRASSDGHDDGTTANLSFGFDKAGNLVSRADNFGATENFCYDELDRLKNYSVGGTSCTTGAAKTVSYNAVGNITNKSDLAGGSGTGNYSYPAAGTPLPHAVKSIAGIVNGTTNPKYKYDLVGNLVCEYTGSSCAGSSIASAVTYWSFNITNTMTQGTASASFTYDAEHSRITQALVNGSTTTTTNYLNDPVHGAMSEKVITGSSTTWNDYLLVDGRMVGERSTTAGTSSWSYFLLDHLGSISVTTDGSAAVTARQSFDAWGRRRNQDGTDNSACAPTGTATTTRGFTSQEEIDAFCIVNLNARLYDPTIGRMMSADSAVSDPDDPQSFNRYTYVDNRPLSLTDPTGHDPFPGSCGIGCISSFDQLPPDSYPTARCWGDCPFGSGIGLPDYGGTTLLDRITAAGGRNISLGESANGTQMVNFTCDAGSSCEGIGNAAVLANGGTITGEGESGRFADFVHQLGVPAVAFDMGGNNFVFVTGARAAALTAAFNNAVDGNSLHEGIPIPAVGSKDREHWPDMIKGASPKEIGQLEVNALDKFGIDIPSGSLLVFMPYQDDEGYTVKTGTDTADVLLGPKAFISIGFLGSTISHEIDYHIVLQLKHGIWYADTQKQAALEIQAYDLQMSQSQVTRFGLDPKTELPILKGYRDWWFAKLTPMNQSLVNSGHVDWVIKKE